MRRAPRTLRILRLGLLAAACAPGSGARADSPLASPFHVIAHRGASAEAPENTLPAFERALELGAPCVELDVQLSRDGVLVLFHDATLDEKTDLSGRVADHTAEALLHADIGRWFDARRPGAARSFAGTPLATLQQVFERFGGAFHYHVEMKSQEPSLPARILELTREHSLEDRLTLTSFHLELLRRARALDARVPITWLLDASSAASIDQAARLGFQMVAFPAESLDEELVRSARRAGLEIRAYRVKTPEHMERAIRLGTNGMTIDEPDRLIRRLHEIRQAGASGTPPGAQSTRSTSRW